MTDMQVTTAPNRPQESAPVRPGGLARRLVLGRLGAIRQGRLTVHESGTVHQFGSPAADGLTATIRVEDPRFFTAVLRRGSIGAAEAFMDGQWQADDLTAVVRVLIRNQGALQGMEGGLARLAAVPMKLWHALRRNTERGSRRNIAEHYDLNNDFFALFLDESMTYSAGIFERPQSTLEQASIAKIDRLCRKLDLKPDDHLLEIGTGWGALAVHAASQYGCRVTTTTISKEQFRFASDRVRAVGLEHRIELLQEDYRQLEGRFDKLVSVEMIEAVGHHYFDAFFAKCASLLKDDGLMMLQAITIADQYYERARRSVDFIQRYIFPGSTIPSVTALCSAMTKSSDLRLVGLLDLTLDYSRTLREWRLRFLANSERIRALGFDERFMRMWEFYLCYCEGGFAERHIGDVQMQIARPGFRGEVP